MNENHSIGLGQMYHSTRQRIRKSIQVSLPVRAATKFPGVFIVMASVAFFAAEASATILTTLSAEKRIVLSDTSEQWAPFETVLPGEAIRYTVSYINEGPELASRVKVQLPIPSEVDLIADSAEQDGVTVAYSIDGGATFAPLDQIIIEDAEGRQRPARADDINALEWTVLSDVQSGGEGTVSCDVLLK